MLKFFLTKLHSDPPTPVLSGTRPGAICGVAIPASTLVAVGAEDGSVLVLDVTKPDAWVHTVAAVHGGGGHAIAALCALAPAADGKAGAWRLLSGSIDESMAAISCPGAGQTPSVGEIHPGFGSEISALGAIPGDAGDAAAVACRDATVRSVKLSK
jgi:hypothetical protein